MAVSTLFVQTCDQCAVQSAPATFDERAPGWVELSARGKRWNPRWPAATERRLDFCSIACAVDWLQDRDAEERTPDPCAKGHDIVTGEDDPQYGHCLRCEEVVARDRSGIWIPVRLADPGDHHVGIGR